MLLPRIRSHSSGCHEGMWSAKGSSPTQLRAEGTAGDRCRMSSAKSISAQGAPKEARWLRPMPSPA